MKVLVTGATGYVGGRLIPELLKKGHQVRVLVRNPARIQGRNWTSQVEVFKGDLLSSEDLGAAFKDLDAAYYLVHSMRAGRHFEDRDREAAHHFVAAAKTVPHVIYLGGLIPYGKEPSAHLLSREEVGRILRENLPTTEFRAGPIIGSGSASFEMIRYLTERLPIMIAPRWILNEIQPIAICDVLNYLVSALESPPLEIVEVGARSLEFKAMMKEYAEVRGLKRLIIPVPVFAPKLAGLWIGLVTPIPKAIGLFGICQQWVENAFD